MRSAVLTVLRHMYSSYLLRWHGVLAGFSTWLVSLWHSHFRLLLPCGPQNGIGILWPCHLTPPCPSRFPCSTDRPPPAAAPLHTVGPPQGAPLPSRKTVMAPRWWEDKKLPFRRRQAGGGRQKPVQGAGGEGNAWTREIWLPGRIYQTWS